MGNSAGSGELSGGQFMIRVFIGFAIVGAVAFGYYATREPDEPAVAEEKKEKFTGTDYHSTALRARERAREQVDKANAVREEQVKEEQEFDKK